MNEKELAKLISTLPPDKRLAFLEALKSQKKKEESIRFDLDEILFDKQIEVFNKASDKNVVVCSRRCLAEGTLVKTEFGVLPIEEVKVGMRVWGYNEDGTVTLAPVLKTFDNGEKECVTLRFSSQEIVCTKEHKFLCYNTYNGVRVQEKAENLKSYSRRKVVVKTIPETEVGEHIPLAYTIGYVQGNGCMTSSYANILHLSSNHEGPIEKVAFQMKGEYKKTTGENFTWGVKVGSGSEEYKIIKELFLDKKSFEKHISYDFIRNWDYKSKCELLAGLLDSDGSFYEGDGGAVLSFCSQSEPTVSCVISILLELFNITAKIRKDNREKYKNGAVFYISFKGIAQLKYFYEKMQPYLKRIEAPKSLFVSITQRRADSRGYILQEGIIIKRTYDLRIGNTTNLYLLAGGEVTHNSGKSFFVATLLIYQAMRIPDNNFLYIGLSKTAARRVIWSTITRLITDYGVDAHVDNHQLQIRFPNRSVIYIEGAKDAATIERLRGLFCQTVVLDESQAFPIGLATSLVQDVLLPSLSDYDGQLFLTGTPDPLLQSVLYRAWEGTQKGWIGFKRFGWNVTDNKKFPRFVSGKSTPETYLQEIMDKTGYTADSPTFRREYLGEFVKSEGSLVYEFNYDRNTVEDLPSGVQWLYVMSGDVGFRDSDAIVVVAFSYFHPVAYVVEEFSKSGLSADDFVVVYKDLYDKYKPISNVIEFAGGGLKIIETLNQRFKMCCKPCKKFSPKSIGAAVLSNEFISKRLMVLKSCDTLISQLESITWISKTDRDGNVKQIIPDGFQVRDAFGEVVSDDCADSLLYALNELRNYNAVELTEDTSVEAEVKKHKEALLRRVKERKERENRNDNFFY